MTREAYLKHKDLIEAWVNGAEIEVYKETYREWTKINNPMWIEAATYRIKPKPKQTIAEWLEENNSDYVPDWEDIYERKYFIYFNHTDNKWYGNSIRDRKVYGAIYMSLETVQRLLDLLYRGEVIED